MSLPRYPEYKDSGIDWLGDVPAHWDVVPLKRSFQIVGGSTPKSDKSEYWDGSITWVSPADLSKLTSIYIDDSARKITEEGLASCGTTLVPSGSIVLSTRAPIGSLAIAAKSLCTNQGCKALVPNHGVGSLYFAYLLLAATDELNIRGRGTTFLELSSDELGAFKATVPSYDEQTAIATFLDHETGKIDALIAEQEQLIALLAEKRQATISHAVTKGLNPEVPMKDSGVSWLGEVPEHWEVTQIKRFCSLITDGAHVSPEIEGGVYHFVSTKDLVGDIIDFDNSLLTSPESYAQLVKNGCRPIAGDILFSKDGTIGRTVAVECEKEFVVASSLIIIRPHIEILRPRFLNYLCKSDVVVSQVESFVKGAGLPRLSIQNLLKVVGVFPPAEEQDAIATLLDAEITRLNALDFEARRSIDLLKERRSALIAASVTGKIDVRGVVTDLEAV